jgi:hypothetical protein
MKFYSFFGSKFKTAGLDHDLTKAGLFHIFHLRRSLPKWRRVSLPSPRRQVERRGFFVGYSLQ